MALPHCSFFVIFCTNTLIADHLVEALLAADNSVVVEMVDNGAATFVP